MLRLTIVVLVVLCAGCAKQDGGRADHSTESDSARAGPGYVNPADVPHPSPPQPSGPQIGRTDSVMNAVAPGVTEWIAMWRPALPGFESDSLWRTGSRRWRPIYVRNLEPEHQAGGEEGLTFQILGLPSPGGRHVLNVDWYQLIQPSGDSLEVGGEPDSQPTLIDHHTKQEAILAQCGTGCGFHWGEWLSTTSFALGGWQDADDFGQWKQGVLAIYSLTDSSVTSYETRIISVADYARYESGWGAWLMRRYRAVKGARPPS
jgi:hypothetical protein